MLSSIRQSAADIVGLSPKIRILLMRILSLSIVYELLKLLPPFVFKVVIDQLVAYDPATGVTPELILYLLVGYAGSMFIMALLDVLMQRVGGSGIMDAEEDVTNKTFAKLLALDLSYHEQRNTGASVNKILKGHGKLVELLFNLMNNLLPVLFQALFTLCVLFWLDWRVGTMFLLFIPLFFWVILHSAKKTQPIREEYSKHHDEFAGVITQSLQNIRTVKDFANEHKEIGKSREKLERYLLATNKRIRIGTTNLLIEDLLVMVARVTTLGIGIYLMLHSHISAGSLVLLMSLSEKAYLNLTRLSRTYYHIQDSEPSVARFKDIFSEPILLEDNPSSKLRVAKGRIEFRDVAFSYGGKAEALKGVSFSIAPKQTIAFVGRSGSGKSTMVKLLLRLTDPTSGCILIDGKKTSEYSFRNLRGGMAVVAQDVELFNDTIFENIAYGVDSATKAEVVRVAKLASAHEFIADLERGYDTVVGERGVKLSGGQKQRIAIARALLRNPKILIFDEATSSLDAQSEKHIHDAIFRLQGKLTLIIIAHRFSTIEHADTIILLEQGRVAEIGTHAQLIAKKGIFAKLRKLQELK